MTVFEIIKEFNKDQMAGFLLSFQKDTINQFARNVFPSEGRILEFLEIEISE